MFERFGHRVQVMYAPADGAGGAATTATGDGGAAAAAAATAAAATAGAGDVVVAPWAESKDQPYSIGGKPWWNSISEEPVRELISQKAYKTPADLALAYHSLNKTFSGNHVLLPGENADEAAMNEFYTKLGRPEAADKYDIKLPDGADVDDGLLSFGKNLAFKLGLPPKTAQAMVDMWQGFATENNEQIAKAEREYNDTQVAEVKTKWGAEFDKNVAAGNRVTKALGLDATTLTAIEKSMGAAPLLDLLARIGRATDEGKLTAGGSGGGAGDNPQSAASEIARLQGDTDFQKKYLDKNHPEHKESVDKMAQLFAKAGSHAPG